MALERLTQITEVGIQSGITLRNVNVEGAYVSGVVTATSLNITGGGANFVGVVTATSFNGNVTGNITPTGLVVSGVSTFQSSSFWGDGDVAYFGDGQDLLIFHNSTDSIIRDNGTGDLYIEGGNRIRLTNPTAIETYAVFNQDGASELYYDNVKRLETSGIGVSITSSLTVGTGASISSPATNVLALGTNNVESVRIDSSGNFNLVNTAGIMTAFKYETPALINNHFKSNSTSAGAYVRMYASAGTGQWDIYNNGANLRFSDNASAGNIVMDRPLTMSGQNIIMSSGNGIDFSATANSSGTMTSELFDDYEYGTWTPSISGSSSGTVTTGTIVGTYTKVGRSVTLRFTFVNPSATTIGGTWRLTGLPFAIRQSANEYVGGYVHYNRGINTAGNWLSLFQEVSSAGLTYFRVMANYMNGTETYDISGNVPVSMLFGGTVFYEAA